MTTLAAPIRIPKYISIDGHKIHHRFLQTVLWTVISAFEGAAIIAAIYYLLIEVHWWLPGGHSLFDLKYGWDHLINKPWWHPDAAHDYRNCFEGALGTLVAKSIITKRKYWRQRVSNLQLVLAPIEIFLISFVIITAGIWLVDIQTRVHIGTTVHNYQAYLIGFIAAQFCHRLWAPAGNTLQLFFLEGAAAKAEASGKLPLWVKLPVAPPVIRERVAWMVQTKQVAHAHGVGFRLGVSVLTFVLTILALYGTFVHFYFAMGHGTAGALF